VCALWILLAWFPVSMVSVGVSMAWFKPSRACWTAWRRAASPRSRGQRATSVLTRGGVMYHVIVRGAVEETKAVAPHVGEHASKFWHAAEELGKEAAVGEALHAIVSFGIKKLGRDKE
jgi:hypothetical protein